MKTYNRALDYTLLALDTLSKGDGVMAARLLAKAVKSSDLPAAIATLEASNKHAFALAAKASGKPVAAKATPPKGRLKADTEFVEEETEENNTDDSDDVIAEFGEDDDPLADLAEEDGGAVEETPGVAMAKVLSSMIRRSK